MDSNLAGATLYTTLEPRTQCNHPKSHCAQRVIDRKIARIVIGMLDPNPAIHGGAVYKLKGAGVTVDFVSTRLENEIASLNWKFAEAQKAREMQG